MEWKSTYCLPLGYEVSDEGDIRLRYVDHEVPVKISTSGPYEVVNYGGAQYMVHKMVAEAFLPKPESYTGRLLVKHKDGDKTNNHVSNLQWVDTAGNFNALDEVKVVDITDKVGFVSAVCAAAYIGVPVQVLTKCITNHIPLWGHRYKNAEDVEFKEYSKVISASVPQIGRIIMNMKEYSRETLQKEMEKLSN